MFNWVAFINLFLVPGLTAGVVCWLLTPVVIGLAKRWGMVDDPKVHKHEKVVHTYAVPRAGGLAIAAGLLVAVGWWLPVDKHLLGILGGAGVALVVGLIDDKMDISPYWRLFGGNLLAALVVIGSGIGIAFLSNPFGTSAGEVIDLSWLRWEFWFLGEMRSIWVLADVFAILWIVGLMNIVGMGAGGIEGQYPGVVAIAATVIGLLSLRFSADITQWPVVVLAGITAGAYLGFLPWNWYPQKIMPGYSGKSLGGFLLAVMAILSTAKVGTLLVVLGVPLIDVGWAVVRRVSQGKSPVWGDRGHLHHKLLDSGWSKRQVVLFYWGVTALLGVLALYLDGVFKFYLLLGLGLSVGGLLVWIKVIKTAQY
jgi:UDP-GlcNAc:undecaprenyl-phosphate GlcNAc-1-phosphate transferase